MDHDQRKSPVMVREAEFEDEVLNWSGPVLVAFLAPWSRPCTVVEAALNEVTRHCAGVVKVVQVNADDEPDLSLWYEIQSIPTLLFFQQGTVRGRTVGTASPQAILAKLHSIFPDDVGPSALQVRRQIPPPTTSEESN